MEVAFLSLLKWRAYVTVEEYKDAAEVLELLDAEDEWALKT